MGLCTIYGFCAAIAEMSSYDKQYDIESLKPLLLALQEKFSDS